MECLVLICSAFIWNEWFWHLKCDIMLSCKYLNDLNSINWYWIKLIASQVFHALLRNASLLWNLALCQVQSNCLHTIQSHPNRLNIGLYNNVLIKCAFQMLSITPTLIEYSNTAYLKAKQCLFLILTLKIWTCSVHISEMLLYRAFLFFCVSNFLTEWSLAWMSGLACSFTTHCVVSTRSKYISREH